MFKRLLLTTLVALVMLLPVLPVQAQEPDPRNAWEAATAIEKFLMAATVIPVTLILVGEMWDAVCTRAGFDFAQDEHGFWYCSGIPRRDA